MRFEVYYINVLEGDELIDYDQWYSTTCNQMLKARFINNIGESVHYLAVL